ARSERPAELAARGADFRHENPRASPRVGKLSARLQLWIACARGSCGANSRRNSVRNRGFGSAVATGRILPSRAAGLEAADPIFSRMRTEAAGFDLPLVGHLTCRASGFRRIHAYG